MQQQQLQRPSTDSRGTHEASLRLSPLLPCLKNHPHSFCLICNYVSKIIPALQSRCTRFRFAPLAPQHVEDRIHHVARLEKCVSGSLPAR